MSRKPRVDRSAEEIRQIVQEGIKRGERVGDVPEIRHRSESVLSLEG